MSLEEIRNKLENLSSDKEDKQSAQESVTVGSRPAYELDLPEGDRSLWVIRQIELLKARLIRINGVNPDLARREDIVNALGGEVIVLDAELANNLEDKLSKEVERVI